MTKTKITNRSSISNTTYHKRCKSEGQRHWWLRGPDGGFIDLGGRHRGDRDIEVELDLPPGTYTLGTGPSGKFGIRETITVDEG